MEMKLRPLGTCAAIGLFLFSVTPSCEGGEKGSIGGEPTQARLVTVAREIMEAARFCALVTLGESGRPQARAMDPFPPDGDLVVWMATNPKSRKVQQIRDNPRVALYYFDTGTSGYVTVVGEASLVDNPEEKARRWKEGWEAFYPDREASYLLIRVVPRRLEVVSVQHGIDGDSDTWEPFSVEFDPTE